MTELRDATLADVPAIMRLERAAFAETAWSESAMRSELGSEHGRYIVAVDGDAVVGYAGLRAVGDDGDIQTICVDDDHQGKGIGRAMLTELIDEARARGAKHVFLEVRDDNASARHLYSDMGWEEIGVRPGYYQPGNIDAIVMRRPL